MEDFLFRVIAREAGRRGMAVQIHVLETFGSYYRSAGAAPHLLEPAFNDSTLPGIKFIVVHGGWPLVNETQVLLAKPNVYADISAMDIILSPAQLSGVLSDGEITRSRAEMLARTVLRESESAIDTSRLDRYRLVVD